MNTKVEEALADVYESVEYFAERADVVDGEYGQPEPNEAMRQHMALTAAYTTLATHIAQQDATIARMREALRLFTGSAYPVEESINPRGYNWSESYLDAALVFAAALKDSP